MWRQQLKSSLEVREKGNELYIKICPYCSNPKENFQINVARKVFHCWACNAKGTVASLFHFLNLPFEDDGWQTTKVTSEGIKEELTLGEFTPIEYEKYSRFLLSKGLGKGDVQKYKLLYAKTGRYKGRLVIPLFEGGKLVYFVSRTLTVKSNYLNPVIDKSNLLPFFYGTNNPLDLYLCEGAFDAISVNKLGYTSGVVLGSSISAKQIKKIKDFGFSKVILCLDGDAHKKTLAMSMDLVGGGVDVYCVLFDKQDEPNDLYVWDVGKLVELLRNPRKLGLEDVAKVIMER